MSQDNQFQQYGYDQYLKAPKKSRGGGGGSEFMESITEKLRSPIVATIALLAAGALFTGVIIMAYPSADNAPEEIPIIKADLSPIKSVPDEPGGMQVPFSDSTVLSSIDQGQPEGDSGRIENLLAQGNEDLGSKEDALRRAMGENVAEEPERIPQERGMFSQENQPQTNQAVSDVSELAGAVQPDESGLQPAPRSGDILQKIEPAMGESDEQAQDRVANAAATEKPKMRPAATSPETIDYVRNALNEDRGADVVEPQPPASVSAAAVDIAEPSPPSAFGETSSEPDAVDTMRSSAVEEEVPQIEPEAGAAASSSRAIEPGNYYVQLASITDRSRADQEYANLQKKFSVLSGLDYRVQEANLDKGTFFRIQAGPFSKSSAKSICDEIKRQKSGGCILVK